MKLILRRSTIAGILALLSVGTLSNARPGQAAEIAPGQLQLANSPTDSVIFSSNAYDFTMTGEVTPGVAGSVQIGNSSVTNGAFDFLASGDGMVSTARIADFAFNAPIENDVEVIVSEASDGSFDSFPLLFDFNKDPKVIENGVADEGDELVFFVEKFIRSQNPDEPAEVTFRVDGFFEGGAFPGGEEIDKTDVNFDFTIFTAQVPPEEDNDQAVDLDTLAFFPVGEGGEFPDLSGKGLNPDGTECDAGECKVLNTTYSALIVTVESPIVEQVPEPISIFGSTVAIGLGAFFTRKRLNKQED